MEIPHQLIDCRVGSDFLGCTRAIGPKYEGDRFVNPSSNQAGPWTPNSFSSFNFFWGGHLGRSRNKCLLYVRTLGRIEDLQIF